jgi:hypothetical protein
VVRGSSFERTPNVEPRTTGRDAAIAAGSSPRHWS